MASGIKYMMVGATLSFFFPYTTLAVLSVLVWLEVKGIDFVVSYWRDALFDKLQAEGTLKKAFDFAISFKNPRSWLETKSFEKSEEEEKAEDSFRVPLYYAAPVSQDNKT